MKLLSLVGIKAEVKLIVPSKFENVLWRVHRHGFVHQGALLLGQTHVQQFCSYDPIFYIILIR